MASSSGLIGMELQDSVSDIYGKHKKNHKVDEKNKGKAKIKNKGFASEFHTKPLFFLFKKKNR
jgi:hypothetical protein